MAEKLENGKEITFSFAVNFNELLSTEGVDGLNEIMDEQFQEQFGDEGAELVEVSYRPVGVDNMDAVIIEASGIVERVDEDFEDEEEAEEAEEEEEEADEEDEDEWDTDDDDDEDE